MISYSKCQMVLNGKGKVTIGSIYADAYGYSRDAIMMVLGTQQENKQ